MFQGSAETSGKILVESATQIDAPAIVQALVESVDGTLVRKGMKHGDKQAKYCFFKVRSIFIHRTVKHIFM